MQSGTENTISETTRTADIRKMLNPFTYWKRLRKLLNIWEKRQTLSQTLF
jgi:hypothetical protein